MRFLKLSLTIFAISLFLMACGSTQTDERVYTDQNPDIVTPNENYPADTEYIAKDNLDLKAVGELLQKADNAEDFEFLINNQDGVNNLDLNGDGYTDYLSVAEYDDNNYDNQRGFTIFDRFGPEEIQEVASIIFDRDRADAPGARILMRGNEQIYGDNNNYQTNWLDKSLAIANWIFQDRSQNYESPYYYDNYPENYEAYRVVETPVYRSRVREYYPEEVFVQTNNPTINNIRIQSPYRDRSIDRIYAGLDKPNREQIEFRRNNPRRPEFVENKNGKIKYKKDKDDSYDRKEIRKEQKQYEKFERKQQKEFEKAERKFEKAERKDEKKFEKRNEQRYEQVYIPDRPERDNYKSKKQEKFERKNERGNNDMRSGNDDRERGGKDKDKGNKGGGKGKKN